MSDHNIEQLVARYVAIRDKKAQIAAERKETDDRINTAMRNIEARILEQMNTLGIESMRTTSGTCYKSIKTSAIVDDRDSFIAFAVEHPEFLESRANKTAVEAYLENSGELPPGVRVNRSITVNVRRS